MSGTYDVVIVGGGIAGGALAAVLARGGAAVAVLERDPMPIDRVRCSRHDRVLPRHCALPVGRRVARGDGLVRDDARIALGQGDEHQHAVRPWGPFRLQT